MTNHTFNVCPCAYSDTNKRFERLKEVLDNTPSLKTHIPDIDDKYRNVISSKIIIKKHVMIVFINVIPSIIDNCTSYRIRWKNQCHFMVDSKQTLHLFNNFHNSIP